MLETVGKLFFLAFGAFWEVPGSLREILKTWAHALGQFKIVTLYFDESFTSKAVDNGFSGGFENASRAAAALLGDYRVIQESERECLRRSTGCTCSY